MRTISTMAHLYFKKVTIWSNKVVFDLEIDSQNL